MGSVSLERGLAWAEQLAAELGGSAENEIRWALQRGIDIEELVLVIQGGSMDAADAQLLRALTDQVQSVSLTSRERVSTFLKRKLADQMPELTRTLQQEPPLGCMWALVLKDSRIALVPFDCVELIADAEEERDAGVNVMQRGQA